MMMEEETLRLQTKLHKLEDVLEKQRWTQKEQAIKHEKMVARLEQELEEQKFLAAYNKEQIQRYQLIFNNLSEGIYAMDECGNVFAINERAGELIDEELITPVLLEATGGSSVSTIIEVDETKLFAPTDVAPPSMVNVTAMPIRDDDGKIVGSLAVVRV